MQYHCTCHHICYHNLWASWFGLSANPTQWQWQQSLQQLWLDVMLRTFSCVSKCCIEIQHDKDSTGQAAHQTRQAMKVIDTTSIVNLKLRHHEGAHVFKSKNWHYSSNESNQKSHLASSQGALMHLLATPPAKVELVIRTGLKLKCRRCKGPNVVTILPIRLKWCAGCKGGNFHFPLFPLHQQKWASRSKATWYQWARRH